MVVVVAQREAAEQLAQRARGNSYQCAQIDETDQQREGKGRRKERQRQGETKTERDGEREAEVAEAIEGERKGGGARQGGREPPRSVPNITVHVSI